MLGFIENQYLYLIQQDVEAPGLPVAIAAVSAWEAAAQYSAATGWKGNMLVKRVLGAHLGKMAKENPISVKAK